MKKSNVQTLVRIVALVGAVLALFGLLFSSITVLTAISGGFRKVINQSGLPAPGVYVAFYLMSVICAGFCVAIINFSVALLRSHYQVCRLMIYTLIAEVLYILTIKALILFPSLDLIIGPAIGVANGGLWTQFLILFPLWGSFILWWGQKKLCPLDKGFELHVE